MTKNEWLERTKGKNLKEMERNETTEKRGIQKRRGTRRKKEN